MSATYSPTELQSFLKFAIPNKINVLVTGAPGVGKTDIITEVSKDLNMELMVMHPVISDPTDFKGLPTIAANKKHATFLPFGDLVQLLEAKKPMLCFMDDIGQAPVSVQSGLMQLLQARRINGYIVSDHVTFIGATNRKADKAGVKSIIEPVKSRYVIVGLEPKLDDWCSWANQNNMPHELVAFVRFKPSMMFDFKPTPEMENSPCPRTVAMVGKLMNLKLPENLEYAAFSGAAGEGFAAEFLGFIRLARKIPNVDYAIQYPDKFEVPTDPAIMYAFVAAIARKAIKTNMDTMLKITNRLPPEFSVMMMQDIVRRDKSLSETKGFISWIAKNAEVII